MIGLVARPPTLTATVADSIRQAILHGDLQPGAPLREAELSASLEVSRGTVREALRMLRDENLVEVIPHRGVFVTKLSARTAKELFTVRALIEPYAVQLAMEANAYTEQDLARIEEMAQRLGEMERLDENLYETAKADVDFHYLICSRSNHELLLQILRSLQTLTWLFVYNIHFYHSGVYSDEPSHYEIYEAIRSGASLRAAETLKNHINAAGSSLLTCLDQEGWAHADMS
jgi:DNA-binding GntR family transcriptional regulator